MIISNTSSKVIFIGTDMLLPDDQVEIPDNKFVPSLEALEKMKAIKIIKGRIKEPIPVPRDPTPTHKMNEEEPKEMNAEEQKPIEDSADKPVAAKKGGRPKKSEE